MCSKKDWVFRAWIGFLLIIGITIIMMTAGCIMHVHPNYLDCVLISDGEVFCR